MPLLRAAEAAKVLGISKRSLERYAKRGCPHVAGPLRFDLDEVQRWRDVHLEDRGQDTGTAAPDPPAAAPAPKSAKRRRSSRVTAAPTAPISPEVAEVVSSVAVDVRKLRAILRERELTPAEYKRVLQAEKVAKTLKTQEQAEAARLAVLRERGELIEREAAEDEWCRIAALIRDRVMQIAPRCAYDVAGMASEAECAERVEQECIWALEELSGGSGA